MNHRIYFSGLKPYFSANLSCAWSCDTWSSASSVRAGDHRTSPMNEDYVECSCPVWCFMVCCFHLWALYVLFFFTSGKHILPTCVIHVL